MRSRRPHWHTLRDVLFFAAGFTGTLHETFFENGERKALLALFALMMGLSGALRVDTIRREAFKYAEWRRRRRFEEEMEDADDGDG